MEVGGVLGGGGGRGVRCGGGRGGRGRRWRHSTRPMDRGNSAVLIKDH